jgi:hypothetical protein
VLDRDDDPAPGQDVRRVARVPRRRVDAVLVLEVDLGALRRNSRSQKTQSGIARLADVVDEPELLARLRACVRLRHHLAEVGILGYLR